MSYGRIPLSYQPSEGGEGAEVIYALRNNEKLSQNILNELASSGQKIRRAYQRRGTTNSNLDYYYILRDTKPLETVIIEYGFLDNKNDVIKLNNNYKDYALAVVNAVLDYKGIIPNEDYYIVKKGDTLYSIARKFGITIEKLKYLNNLNSNIISINQKLIINDKNFYSVIPGDTLYSIARRFNTTVSSLKEKNNLTSDLLSIGQKLII